MTTTYSRPDQRASAWPLAARLPAAVLCLVVAAIHVLDQGGLTALKDPAYVGYGYWLLEIAAVLCAVLLLVRPAAGWLLALGVAAGPLVGFVLSRGPGLPDYSDDRGNWTEPLGLLAIAVEVVLVLLALAALARGRRSGRA